MQPIKKNVITEVYLCMAFWVKFCLFKLFSKLVVEREVMRLSTRWQNDNVLK